MKVRELIHHLNRLDPELDVFGYCEDEGQGDTGQPFGVFDVQAITATRVITSRSDEGRPRLTFENEGESRPIVLLDLTQDF